MVEPTSPLDRLVAAARPMPAAELSPVARRTRLILRATDEGAIARAGEAFGVSLPRTACTFEAAGSAVAIWLGPDEWYLGTDASEPAALVERIATAVGPTPHGLVDVSDRSVTIAVRGPMAATIINAGCPLDLYEAVFPAGSGTRTVFGKSEIVLARVAPEAFEIDVWRSFAPYVWTYLDEARREFAA